MSHLERGEKGWLLPHEEITTCSTYSAALPACLQPPPCAQQAPAEAGPPPGLLLMVSCPNAESTFSKDTVYRSGPELIQSNYRVPPCPRGLVPLDETSTNLQLETCEVGSTEGPPQPGLG